MRELAKKWMLDCLSTHASEMYSTLLYDKHLCSETLKEIEFEGMLPARGYFAKKARTKYWIEEHILKSLPIKLGDKFEELIHKEDVVKRPLKPVPFKITPQQMYPDTTSFVDDYLPFKHSQPDQFLLAKIVCLASYIGRTYVCMATEPEFCKSSMFDALDYLTDKSPVFKPRSVPGVLNKINSVGIVCFDEVHQCEKKVKDIIEEFCLQIGGNKAVYLNGALSSQNTKAKYDCILQSIVFLYNTVKCYKNPEKDYFDGIFVNNKAIDTRFLKIKLKGKLTEQFDKDFDIPACAKEHKWDYIKFAKHLLWLQQQKQCNKYKRRWEVNSKLELKGRRKMVMNEILWVTDMYSESQLVFNKLVGLLDDSISSYAEMVSVLKPDEYKPAQEEIVK